MANFVNLKISGNYYDYTRFVAYIPHENIIMVKEADEGDVWYKFIKVVHIPEIKVVIYVSNYSFSQTMREIRSYKSRQISNGHEWVITDIMGLDDDYIITNNQDVFNHACDNYIGELHERLISSPNLISQFYPPEFISAMNEVMPHQSIADMVLAKYMVPPIWWLHKEIADIPCMNEEYLRNNINTWMSYFAGIDMLPRQQNTRDLARITLQV